MRTRSRRPESVLAVLGALAITAAAAQGCSSSPKTSGFTPDDAGAPAASLDATADATAQPDPGGPILSDDGGDAKSVLSPDAACATATAQTQREPVYLLFVVDGSGSMGQENKWVAEAQALDAIFDDMLAQQDKSLGVGVVAFSDSGDPTSGSGPYPTSADVFVGYVDQTQHDALRARIDNRTPMGGTPTFTVLSGTYKKLENLVAPAPLPPNGRKVLVLLTDGVPDNGATEQAQCTTAAANELTAAAPKGPIETFAIGVGPFPSSDTLDYDPAFLGRLAQAGGTAPAGCDPASTSLQKICHFQVTPNGNVAQIKQSFIDAIDKIRGQVTSCEFTLSLNGQKIDPTQVNVVFTDGSGVQHIVPQDPSAGWTYDDPNNPTKVILHGNACDAMKSDGKGQVSILIGCKTQTN